MRVGTTENVYQARAKIEGFRSLPPYLDSSGTIKDQCAMKKFQK